MKIFWRIVAGILVLLVVIIIGLELYFTDARLKKTVLPYLDDAVGRPVQVEHMSLSFFSTFPHPGLQIDNMVIPGKAEGDTLLSLHKMVAGVELFPLFSNKVNFTELDLSEPHFTYIIYPDSTTNLDFLLNKEETDTTSGSYNVNIPYFQITNGRLGYHDFTSNTRATLDNLDGDLSLSYADSIASSIDMEVGSVSATIDSVNYLNGIPLTLTEESTIYSDQEIIRLKKGGFSLRGLKMDLTGAITNWSKTPAVDLQFNSSSDDFGALLKLLPKSYSEYTDNLQSKGSLSLGGTVNGPLGQDDPPAFDVHLDVQNGYLKDPKLPQPIENIQLSAQANNKLVTIKTLNAKAGANHVSGSGTVNDPLEDNGTFNMDFVADVDLSTVHQFYDLSQMDVDELSGKLNVDTKAKGSLNQPEKATFDGKAMLANGMLKYKSVPKAITNININASGSQDLLTIQKFGLQAEQNSLTAKGDIRNLLDENKRHINMDTNLRFDLATIKDFYPISEDTLKLQGLLTAQATLNGAAKQIEHAVQSGNITLKNGLVDYKKMDAPFRNISFESVLDGNKMTIVTASFVTGDNSVKASGLITNYLSDDRMVNLKASGDAKLQEIAQYYDLKPNITKLSGDAKFNLGVTGPPNDPSALALSGNMTVKNAAMEGDALQEPVSNLNGIFNLSPKEATLSSLTFKMGSSDINVKGALNNYMQYLKDEKKRTVTPHLSGSFKSNYLNLDELIDWSDTTSTSYNLDLPDLNSSVTASITKMVITGVTMQNLQAQASSTPKQINLNKAHVQLFGGNADGTFQWDLPGDNKASTLNFKGALDSLRLQSFFKDFPILGEKSDFYKFISGTFSTNVDYTTKIDKDLNPLLATTLLNGTFGMSKAQVNNHPIQQRLANFTKIKELSDVALDKWQSSINVKNNVLTISDLSLTSKNIGLELNGTQQLVTDKIDFAVTLLLPSRYKQTLASVITSQAADALTRDNGTIMVPLRLTGTYSNPSVQPDQNVIKPIVQKYLKGKAGNVLKNLLNRNKKQTKPDTAKVDTTSGS